MSEVRNFKIKCVSSLQFFEASLFNILLKLCFPTIEKKSKSQTEKHRFLRSLYNKLILYRECLCFQIITNYFKRTLVIIIYSKRYFTQFKLDDVRVTLDVNYIVSRNFYLIHHILNRIRISINIHKISNYTFNVVQNIAKHFV